MRASFSIIVLIIISCLSVKGQELSIPIKVSCGADSQILYLGLDPKATDGLDASLGETSVPPLPPKGAFDTRINLPDPFQESTLKDIRFGNTKTFKAKISHEIQFQPGSSSAIEISWVLPAGITGTIQDKFEGLVLKKTMNGSGSVTVTNSAINKLDIIFDYNFTSTGIEVDPHYPEYLPSAFNLSQNYPNPFNPATTIVWQLGEACYVTLKVYDMLGREVSTLVNGYYNPGFYQSIFNSQDLSLSTGVYSYQITAGKFSSIKKMLMIK